MEQWIASLLLNEKTAIEATKAENMPSEMEIRKLCERMTAVLHQNPTSYVEVQMPITVVGDIHGQLYDLLELFRVGGPVPETNYLFLGDYVDRGYYSVETILLLFFLKVHYPNNVTLLRGNHETRQITQVYGFYDECIRKYNGSCEVWKIVTSVFDFLPIAGIISGPNFRALAVHAGLSPHIATLDELKSINCKGEIPHDGPCCDLLWSDPDETISGWGVSQRGAGYIFGGDVLMNFNHLNDLDLLCRSHQLVMEGYKKIFQDRLTTVWSAPNYCYRCGNSAAILNIGEVSITYDTFREAPGPFRVFPYSESRKVDYFM